MQILRRVVLSVALVTAATTVTGCAVAQPVPSPYGAGAPANVPPEWEENLGAYGSWRTLPNYGTVWYPSVGAGWRPYTYGSWAWGPGGWTWYSTEPWGFTFHYGRWAWAPIGWVWVPGFVWGPAWVNWYWGSGYVGWAPLGYYSAVPWAQFVFVYDRDFNCDDVHKKYHRYPPRGGGYHHGPPPHSHIQRVAHDPIVRVSASQLPNRSFPQRRGGTPRAQSPGASPTPSTLTPQARPRGDLRDQGRPPVTRDQAAVPQQGRGPQTAAPPRPTGSDGPRPPAAPPSRGYVPQSRPPYASPQPPTVAPRTMQQPQGYGAYPGAPQSVPRAMQPSPRVAPPSQGVPRMAPTAPPLQTAPRTAPMAPPTQSAPRMAPMAPPLQSAPRMAPLAPPASSAPRMAPPMQSAPAAPFTGGGRGFGQGRGGYSPGMR